ncbi:MAG: hypothetical protein INF89_16720 [Roseomonas sp.]|nr:hypothetical protein [Roseomonas sp.]
MKLTEAAPACHHPWLAKFARTIADGGYVIKTSRILHCDTGAAARHDPVA